MCFRPSLSDVCQSCTLLGGREVAWRMFGLSGACEMLRISLSSPFTVHWLSSLDVHTATVLDLSAATIRGAAQLVRLVSFFLV